MFHRPLGCTAAAVLPKQDSGTSQIQVYPTKSARRRVTLYIEEGGEVWPWPWFSHEKDILPLVTQPIVWMVSWPVHVAESAIYTHCLGAFDWELGLLGYTLRVWEIKYKLC